MKKVQDKNVRNKKNNLRNKKSLKSFLRGQLSMKQIKATFLEGERRRESNFHKVY